MYEVEVKVPADHGTVRDRLSAIGAEPVGAVVQRDTYYDHPVRSFAATDEALRIRRESERNADDERAALTYKGPLVEESSKTREEVETSVGDAETAGRMLEALDFTPAATVRKERDRFLLEEYTVTLDTVTGLGEFVEVETEGGAEEIDALRDGALQILTRLGLDSADQIRASYLELLAET